MCDTTVCDATVEYFYLTAAKEQLGPFSVAELCKRFGDGSITHETLIWEPKMPEWCALHAVRPLFEHLREQVDGVTGPPAAAPIWGPAGTAASAAAPPSSTRSDGPPARSSRISSSSVPQALQGRLSKGIVPSPPPVARGPSGASPAAGAAAAAVAPGGNGGNGGAVAAASSSGASTPRKGAGGVGAVRRMLEGFFGSRKPADELVSRGILERGAVSAAGEQGSKRKGKGKGKSKEGASDGPGPSGGGAAAAAGLFYGASLGALLARPDTGDGVPALVRVLVARLQEDEEAGLRMEGVFRVPGDAEEMRRLRARLNEGSELAPIMAGVELTSVAGMLKMFFRELAEPLLSFELYPAFIKCGAALGKASGAGSGAGSTEQAELTRLLGSLPPGHHALLRYLVRFLAHAVSWEAESKMGVSNLAAVFAPNLLRPREETLDALRDSVHAVSLVAALVARCDDLFGPAVAQPAPAAQQPAAGPVDVSDPAGEPSPQQPAEQAAPASRAWYYAGADKSQQGPVAWGELQRLFGEGRIDASTCVWAEGMVSWSPAGQVGLPGSEPQV